MSVVKQIDWDSIPYSVQIKIIKLERQCDEISWSKGYDWKNKIAKIRKKIDKILTPYTFTNNM